MTTDVELKLKLKQITQIKKIHEETKLYWSPSKGLLYYKWGDYYDTIGEKNYC